MNTVFHPNDTLTNRLSFYHLALFGVLLPFDRFYSELVLISFLLHTVISLRKQQVKNLFRIEVLWLVSVFLVALVCTLYTFNKQEGFKLLSRQLAIVLFPVLLFLNPVDLRKYAKAIFLSFAFSCTLVVAYLYADAIQVLQYHHLPLSALLSPAFMNHNFSEPIDMHATYLSLYMGLSVAIFSHYLIAGTKRITQLVFICALCLLALGLLQLAARSVIIAMLLFFCFAVPFFLQGKRRKIYATVAISISLVVVVVILASATLRTRYFDLLKDDLSENTPEYSIADARMKRWEVAWEVVKASPLVGYGSGDEEDLLQEAYFQNKLYDSYLHRLNAHNQYLSFLLMGGVIALAVYLFTLAAGVRMAIQQKNLLFLAFLFLIITVSISENILFRNKGIFFYSFFFSLFVRVLIQQKIAAKLQVQEASTGNLKRKTSVFTMNK